jgi:hypothetical protein
MGSSRPVTYQSLPYTWVASSSIFVDLSFLNPARAMKAPVVTGMRIRFSGTMDTGASGMPARCFPQIYSQIRVSDIAGDRVNMRGSSLRVVDQFEYGVSYSDCTPTTTIAATQTAATLEFYLRIPFQPYRCQRREDFGMGLREFLDGGQIQIVTQTALIASGFGTTKTGTITVYVDIVDEGVAEAKSRITWFDQNISKSEDQYNVSGLARYLIAYNGEINERVSTQNPTPWTAGQTVTSKTLEISQVVDSFYVDYYKQESRARIGDPGNSATASVVTTEDTVVQRQAIPFLIADADESTSSLPQMATVHYKTSLSITAADLPQLIACVVTERSDAATARTLGADWRQKIGQGKGVVGAADGNHRPVTSFNPAITKFLPLRLM